MSYDPRIHPQITALFDAMKEAGLKRVESLTPDEARWQHRMLARARLEPEIEMGLVENFAIDAPGRRIPCRLYYPKGYEDQGPLPLLMYFHGGGHVIGDLDTHDQAVRNLSTRAGCIAVSVDYRKGPENPFPAAPEDCFFATRYIADRAERYGADPARIAVGGDSAGGNLAAVTALLARERGGPSLCFQLLVYPVVDYRGSFPSYEEYAEGFGVLEAKTVAWFRERYVEDEADLLDWRCSPLLAQDLSGLPPALVLVAELDVLHDEGVAYAERLKEAGVPVDLIRYPGQIHAFFTFTHAVDDAHRAQQDAAAALKARFELGYCK
ncbi:MAG: alpha/beta hydrolase [Alphaproteobacteria bacterium]|nr:alpha/beta hydrolase [Alphaproteobacteria bacterium]